jgi:AraC-like DNA-binding protein
VLLGFVDAESELGGALTERTASEVAPIPVRTVREWRAQLADAASLTAVQVEPWVKGTLLRHRRPSSIDHRVMHVLRNLPNRLAEAEAVSLDVVAASVGLSPSRFLHLFTASVGVPLRPYVLWLRLQCGARELAGGSPLQTQPTRPGSPMRHTSRAHFAACSVPRLVRSCSAGWPLASSISNRERLAGR